MARPRTSERDNGGGAVVDKPKKPRRQRGKDRVSALLEAAAAVFVEKGFDGATMTEIADRANASIGSLYQFFPSKESLADTLRTDFASALCERVADLRTGARDRSASELADLLFQIDLDVLSTHPSFAVLQVTRGRTSPELVAGRARLADELLALFALHAPEVPTTKLREVGIVTRQLLRSSIEMILEGGGENAAGVDEMRRALREYLKSRLEGPFD